jgi:hypothetical protein
LLSLKYSEAKPKNPLSAIREFFGNYHDRQWDEQESLKEEILLLSHENPKLLEKVLLLEEQLETVKRNHRYNNLFKSYEADKNVRI